jgi:membrane-bound lytic murein transglycosylase B
MDDVSQRRRPVIRAVARRAGPATLAVCLLVSCSSQETTAGGTQPDRGAGGSPAASSPPQSGSSAPPPSPGPGPALARLPAVPTTSGAAVLAGQLDDAMATVRDPQASASDVRRAGEFQQLAVRALATAPDAFRRKVIARLHPMAAQVTRGAVRAARSLHTLTDPQKKLPRWRIVAPPPPAVLLGYYRQAQRRTGVPWTYLAAIHLVETRMGRIRGASTAGALGPMQFLPSTWQQYGAGGDINDPRDAVLAAARLLRANGAPRAMARALWHYNPADSYVRAVAAYARTMQRSPSAYRGYWHWRVLYRHVRGTYALPIGYPKNPAVLLRDG